MSKLPVKKPRIVVIVGPTASGKSNLAVALARTFDGEVISADSRQVYRDLNIGTGKITKREMHGVPHYLLDVADPRRTYTGADFARDASEAVRYIVQKGKLPIICGGTGFYIDLLLGRRAAPAVPPNTILRAKLKRKTAAQLFTILKKLDPRRAENIDPKNTHRLIRAIEVAKALGSVPPPRAENRYETLWIGLTLPRERLRERISRRLRARLKRGMIAEARRLHRRGLTWKRMGELGLEYRWLAKYCRGKISREESITGLERDILRYAKRQMTWFKRNKDIHWIASPYEIKKTSLLVKRFLRT